MPGAAPIILGIDPGLSCTGWAAITPDMILGAGTCIPKDGGTAWVRCLQLIDDIGQVIESLRRDGHSPTTIVVETPQTYTRGMSGKRSLATLPGYGMAVCAALVSANSHKGGCCDLIETSASEWSRHAPATRGDSDKRARVDYIGHLYGRAALDGMAKAKAAAIADAVLIARWQMLRNSDRRIA